MKRPIVFVILSGMGAMLAAIVVFSAIRKRDSEVQRAMARTLEIVVAAKNIQLGAKLDPDDVKLVRWARDSVPQGAFTDPQSLAGSFASGEFEADEPIVANKLFMGEKAAGVMPLLIPAGMRAMSVPVDEVADIAGFVAPHTRVDVLCAVSGSGPGETPFSRIVLQNIEVIAVAQEIETVKDEPQVVRVVTLLVTPADAEKLTLASHEGLLRLAMRNYSDNKIVATNGIAIGQLLNRGDAAEAAVMPVMQIQPAPAIRARSAHAPTTLRLEVMRDGKSDEALSFVHSGAGAPVPYEAHQEGAPQTAPAASGQQAPAVPPMPEEPETPVSSAKPGWSASFAASPPIALAGSPSGAADADPPPNPAAPLRPGDPGYQPAPKVYEVR